MTTGTSVPSSAAPVASRTAPVPDAGAEVDAEDQSGDGATVVVRDARITVGPGWLAVRTDDGDGVFDAKLDPRCSTTTTSTTA